VSVTDLLQRTRLRPGVPDGVPATPPLRGRQYPFLGLVVLVGLFAPAIMGGSDYDTGVLTTVIIHAVLTLGLFWCFSLGGLFTFATYGVYAAGAYTSIWAANHLGGFWSGLVAATLIGAVLGALITVLFARCSMVYFAIATMACGALLVILFREWTSFTGGFSGQADIKLPSLFGYQLDTYVKRYYLMFAVLALLLLLTIFFLRSPAARDLQLAKGNGPVAAVIGLHPKRAQSAAFIVGCAIQGIAGSLYAHNTSYISLEAFHIDIALLVLLMLLLGGVSSIYGPLIGAALLIYLPEYLRDIQKYSDLVYGVAVLVVVVAFPKGIAGVRGSIQKRINHA